jgi:HAD superfamily hydrolase (TIGR01509 family)
VERVLRLLKERQRAIWIVTGSGQKSLFARLEGCFPGVFAPERMVTAYDVKHGKPDPEPYLKAWERSGYSKEQCCVIENAPLGVRAGKAAGLYTIAVNTGPLPDEMLQREGADQVFPDMDALYNWLVAK